MIWAQDVSRAGRGVDKSQGKGGQRARRSFTIFQSLSDSLFFEAEAEAAEVERQEPKRKSPTERTI